MSMSADIRVIGVKLHEKYGLSKDEATEIYVDILESLEWDTGIFDNKLLLEEMKKNLFPNK